MDNQKKPSKYGTLYHKPEHYERLWMLESSRKPEYLNNTFEADNERAGGMQLRRIAFDELQNKGYFKGRKYEEITPNEAMAGAMKYSSIIADNYGLTNEYWNALAFKEGPTAIKALYDKHQGNLKKAMNDPALRTEGREYLTKYLKTKLSDQINEKPTYVKDMYKVILEGGDINSVDPKKYFVSNTVKKAQAGLEIKKEDNGWELNNMMTMPGMTKYTAGLSPITSTMANSIGLNGQTKGDLLGGAGLGALSGFLSGGLPGAVLGGGASLLAYGSKMAGEENAKYEAEQAELKARTIPGRTGFESPLQYAAEGGPTVTKDTIYPNPTNQFLFEKYKKDGVLPKFIVNETGSTPGRELSGFEKGLKKADDVLSAPARYMVQAITGKYQDPSEAWGYNNPQGFWQNAANVGIDIVADPMNLLGVGIAEKVGFKTIPKLTKLGKASEIGNTVGDVVIKADLDLARKYMSDPKNLKDFYKGKVDSKFNDFVNIAYREMPEIKTVVEKSLKLNKPEVAMALINDAIKIKEGGGNYNKKTPVYPESNFGPLASGYKAAVPSINKAKITKKLVKTAKPSIINQAITNVENKVAEEKKIVIPQHSKMVNGQRIPITEKEANEIMSKGKVSTAPGQTIKEKDRKNVYIKPLQQGGDVPTAADTLALQKNAVAIQNAVLKMHGTENFPVANKTINPNKDGSHVDELDIPMGPQRDGEKTIIPIDKNKYYMKDTGLPDNYPPTLIDKRIAPNSIQHIFYPPTLSKPGQYDNTLDQGKRVYIVPNYDYKQQQGGEVVPRLLNNFIKKYSGGGFSTEGYRSDSPDVDNSMNIIPGGNISMKDVNFPVNAFPITDGQIQGPFTMTPDKEYKFSSADAVIEIPEAQMGMPVNRDTIYPNASNKVLFDMYSKGNMRPKYIINENQQGTPDELTTLEKGLKYADDILSAPSRGMVKLITGKYQDPSEAWGYQNPQGFLQNAANIAIDMVADPTNLLGVGMTKNVVIKTGTKLLKVGKASDIADKTGLIIKTSTAAAKEYMKDPKNLKDLYSNKYLNADSFKKFTEMAYKEMPEIQTNVNKTLKINKPGAATALVNDVIDIKKGKEGYNKNTPVYENQNWGPLASGYKNAIPSINKAKITKKLVKTAKPSIIKQAVTNVENKVAEEKQIVIPQHSKMVNGQRIPITEKEANEIMSKGKVTSIPGQTIKEKDRKNVYIKPLQHGGYVEGETYELDDKEIKRLLSLGYQIQ